MRDNIHQEGAHDIFLQRARAFQDLADACRSDEDRLREVEEHPKDVLREHGHDVPAGMDVKVVLNTRDIFHLAMPPDPNQMLQDEALMVVSGGGKTASTAGSLACAGTVPSTASSLSTAGCVGSVDSGGALPWA